MKSLLVDALRHARENDAANALSDSGSHDTTNKDFFATANDAVVEPGDTTDQELALFETVSKPLDSLEPADVTEDVDVDASDELSADVPNVAVHFRRAPGMARFAPLICTLLAVVAAASWMAHQHYQSAYSATGLAMSPSQNAVGTAAAFSPSDRLDAKERFPFLPAADAGAAPEIAE